ncbi:MFS transporter [Gilliamella sp. Choc5-1]|jgi:predicted MFS family arabinose efflux permease|uniref:MFS transporter n=1 Tax=Gilliamella sp. Choc5-1 TaxID=3120238 RepID=UPI00080DF777|nr:MFS transporter [Gilliamella apicola]OCG47169.1 MFS transporter [Gilliamella apicola]
MKTLLSCQTELEKASHWSAIFSLFMGVTSLIAAEFIPISLLTPIAQTLKITEGMAGQTVTAVGIFAVIASLLLAPLTKKINRRLVLLTLSILLIIANILVAFTPNYIILLIGRSILGICVGGFWSMASAVTLQLVPTKDLSRALSIIYAGVSVATIISLPLASYLGNLIGWRNIFLLSALLGAIAFIWQFIALPTLPAQQGNSFKNMFFLLKQSWITIGIVATIFSYGGYHIFFTYLRPFLEHNLALQTNTLSTLLLLFGIANCIGTLIAGFVMGKQFKITMIVVHFILLMLAIILMFINKNITFNILFVIAWGLMFGFIPVGWSNWIVRTLADKAEMMGGLSVAAIQFSIGLAAAMGGIIFDHKGMQGIFFSSALIFLCALILIKLSFWLFTRVTGHPIT